MHHQFISRQTGILTLSFITSLLFTLLVKDNGFLYETFIQVSIPANYYFEDLSFNLLPDQITTGHPPFVGYYLALIWRCFGKTLLISHLAFFPFVWGILYFGIKLSQKLSNSITIGIIGGLAIFFEPILLGQSSTLSFDAVHAFLFIFSIYTFFTHRNLFLFISLAILSLTNMRSGLTSIGLATGFILLWYIRDKKITFQKLLTVSIPIILMLIFYTYHYMEKGWVIHNTVSNTWTEDTPYSPFVLRIRNVALILFYLLENGRIWLLSWLAVLFSTFLIQRNATAIKDKINHSLLIIFIVQLGISAAPLLISEKFYVSSKYLMPSIITLFFIGIRFITLYMPKRKTLFISGLLISALLGNFIIYPDTRAQSWDCTAAHWPYFKLRDSAINYMRKHKIPIHSTASFFPNLASFDIINLSGDSCRFTPFTDTSSYVFYSNIYNIHDSVYNELFSEEWNEITKIEKNRIRIHLFKKNDD